MENFAIRISQRRSAANTEITGHVNANRLWELEAEILDRVESGEASESDFRAWSDSVDAWEYLLARRPDTPRSHSYHARRTGGAERWLGIYTGRGTQHTAWTSMGDVVVNPTAGMWTVEAAGRSPGPAVLRLAQRSMGVDFILRHEIEHPVLDTATGYSSAALRQREELEVVEHMDRIRRALGLPVREHYDGDLEIEINGQVFRFEWSPVVR